MLKYFANLIQLDEIKVYQQKYPLILSHTHWCFEIKRFLREFVVVKL